MVKKKCQQMQGK